MVLAALLGVAAGGRQRERRTRSARRHARAAPRVASNTLELPPAFAPDGTWQPPTAIELEALAREQQVLPAVDGRTVSALRHERPWRFAGLTDAWPARKWEREEFLAEHGDLEFRLRPCVSLHEYGYPGPAEARVSLRDYLADGKSSRGAVLFENDFHAGNIQLRRGYEVPELLSGVHGKPIFSLGRKHTGVGFHRHNESWLAQIRGRKVWLMIPDGERPPALPPWRYLVDRPEIMLCCILQPGEILFLPKGWWHATWNLDEFTLGVGWEGGASISWSDEMHAIADGDAERLAGTKPSAECVVTPAMVELAARSGDVDVLRELLRLGADVVLSRDAAPAAVAAARSGHLPVLQLLANQGFAAAFGMCGTGTSALHEAARSGHLAVAEWLIARGTGTRLRDGSGSEPLHVAAEYGQADIVQALLAAGAEVDSLDGNGSTPLLQTAFNGHRAVAHVLLEAGASVQSRDRLQRTALHQAALRGHAALMLLLLEAGADVFARDSADCTPLHMAAVAAYADEEEGSIELAPDATLAAVELLVAAGADVEAQDARGRTGAQYAEIRGHVKVASLLRGASAPR